jgi:hypothetical protein
LRLHVPETLGFIGRAGTANITKLRGTYLLSEGIQRAHPQKHTALRGYSPLLECSSLRDMYLLSEVIETAHAQRHTYRRGCLPLLECSSLRDMYLISKGL